MRMKLLPFLLIILIPVLVTGQALNREKNLISWESVSNSPYTRVKAGKELMLSWIREDNGYALELALEVQSLAENQSDLEVKVIALNGLAYAYEWNSDLKMAAETYELALQSCEQNSNPQEKIDALCGLGRVYFARGENAVASNYYNKAVRLADELNDPRKTADVYVQIAEYYRATAKYVYALKYLNKVREIVSRGQASESVEMELYSRLAAVYNEQNSYRDSIPELATICIELGEKYQDDHVIATAMNELGYYYSERNKTLSKDYYRKAIEIWKQLNYSRYEAHCMLNLYRQHFDDFSIEEKIESLNDLIDRIGDKPFLLQRLELHQMLSSCYEKLGDSKSALDQYKKYLALHATHSDLNNQRALDEIQEKYESERNQRTISEQQVELSNQRLSKAKSEARFRQLLWISIFLFFLLVAVAFVIYRVRKTNNLLTRQKIQIENSKIQLEELLEGRELLLKEIHHRVKNNLQMVVSLLELQALGVKDEETKNVLLTGNQRVKSMALVHKRLYQGNELGNVDVEEYVQSLFSEIDSAFISEGQQLEREVSGHGVKLDVDTIIPLGLILTELITNTFKYANSNLLKISIDIQETAWDQFVLVYKDNGPGIPEDFNIRTAQSLGMRMIKRLTQQLNGTFNFYNEEGLNVEITFEGTQQRQKTA